MLLQIITILLYSYGIFSLFAASYRATVNGNMQAFKLAVLNALKNAGNLVSVLRINNIQVF